MHPGGCKGGISRVGEHVLHWFKDVLWYIHSCWWSRRQTSEVYYFMIGRSTKLSLLLTFFLVLSSRFLLWRQSDYNGCFVPKGRMFLMLLLMQFKSILKTVMMLLLQSYLQVVNPECYHYKKTCVEAFFYSREVCKKCHAHDPDTNDKSE